jgi:hypothetical protein
VVILQAAAAMTRMMQLLLLVAMVMDMRLGTAKARG